LKLRVTHFWAAIAIFVGAVVLLGYFFTGSTLFSVRELLLQWATLIAAGAIFVGLLNLFTVHWNKVNDQTEGWPYSAILIFFFLVTLVLGIIFGPDFEVLILFFNYIQLPIEAALMALLAVTLIVAGFRIVSQRRDVLSAIFIGTALLILLGNSPWLLSNDSGITRLMSSLRAWLAQVWAVGGARGILIGVALGATATGLRVLFGADRPYGE
jgi:hypothetical protein